ncbi:MAG: hypothetical protein N3A38_06335 [Planctomycetota bacterium]|nr:hypothetical protein [Planctomycetota bacterium]
MRYAKPFRIPLKTARGAMLCALACSSGCVRTVLVPPGEPVRLREPIRGAKVWVADKDGREIPATVDLPEGWYCLPDPGL